MDLSRAVKIINDLKVSKLQVLSEQIALGLMEEKTTITIFSPPEFTQLQGVLQINSSQLHLIIDCLNYILHKSAYLKTNKQITIFLNAIGFDDSHVILILIYIYIYNVDSRV